MSWWRSGRTPATAGAEAPGEFSVLGFEGAPSDTAVFPWREDAGASTLDEPVATPAVVVRRPWGADLGLLLVRVVLGGTAVLDGARTLFDLPRGHGGSAAVAAMVDGYGFRPVAELTTALGWAWLVAGVLVLLGVFASFAASALLAIQIVALAVSIPPAWAAGTGGPVQAPLFGLALALAVVLVGPGRVSGDADRAWFRAQTPVGLTCLLIGGATALTVLVGLRPM